MSIRIANLLRIVLISFEFLICMALIVVAYFKPDIVEKTANDLWANNEKLKWLLLAPIGIMAFGFVQNSKMSDLPQEERVILNKWQESWRIEYRRNVSLVWLVACTLCSVSIFIGFDKFDSMTRFLVGIGGITVSAICSLHLYFNALHLRRIFDIHYRA